MTPQQARRLGRFIAAQREARGVSQRKLAEAIGVQNTTIMRLEAGHYTAPSPDNLARIAEVLDIEMADLYAMADYAVPSELPTLTPYLRTKYGELTEGDVKAISAYASTLARQRGVDLTGPSLGEDEAPEERSATTPPKSRSSKKPTKKGGTK